MTVAPIGIQRRMMELGVVRFGEKGPKGEPRRLDHFRLTSASRTLLDAAAIEYGGTVRQWEGAPNDGTWELHTETSELQIVIPPVFSDRDGEPTYPFSQWYELWSGGGCQRRCDGRTESISGSDCLCNADDRACEIVTRVRFILPDLPGIGLWRLNTGGYNAAVELPATLEFLAAQAGQGSYLPAVLRLEQRMSKKDGLTRRFAVPVIDVPELRVRDMLPGVGTHALTTSPPAQIDRARPEIPAGPQPPTTARATHEDEVPFGDAVVELPLEPEPLERREPEVTHVHEPTVEPVAGDTIVYASDQERRNIFSARDDAGVTRDRMKQILQEVSGQETTEFLPQHLVEVVIRRLLEEKPA